MSEKAPLMEPPAPVAEARTELGRSASGLLQGRASRLPVGAPDDPLERAAERVASTVVGSSPLESVAGRAGAPVLRRHVVVLRAKPGSSGEIAKGPLAKWNYVVYPDHVRLGNRRIDPHTTQVIGSWPWLTNNPGDISVDLKKPVDRPEEKRAFGWGAYEGKAASTGHILLAIFPDLVTGEEALQKLLSEPGYARLTIAEAANKHLGLAASRLKGVDDPGKYARLVQSKLDKLGVKVNVQTDRLADLAARGLLPEVAKGFGFAEGVESVGVTYRCSGRDKTDDPQIPQTIRNLRLFKSLPDEAPQEIRELLGCEDGFVQRAAAGRGRPAEAPAIVDTVLASPGRALEPRHRGFLEQRFGVDFERVRIHTDAPAAESATAVDALAYTVGSHIVFGAGRYRPETRAGIRLLAHELAHVVQQGGGAPVAVRRADREEEQPPAATPTPAPPAAAPGTETLESFDVDRPPGTKPWKLDLLSRRIAAGFAASKQAFIEVVGYFDPNVDVAAGGEAGAQLTAAQRRVDVTRRALIQWAVPTGRIRTTVTDTSLGDPRPKGAERRQVDVVLHSAAAQAAPAAATAPPAAWLVVTVPPEEPTAEQIFRAPPPPVFIDAPASLTGALLRLVAKDVDKLIDSPIALPAALIIDHLPAEWEVRKKIKQSLREIDKPSKAPPLTDVGTFADPRFRDIQAEQQAAREAMPTTVAKAFLFAGQAAIPAPTRDPGGTTFFIKLPAIPLP